MKLRSLAFALSLATVSLAAAACGGSVEHSPQTSAGALTKAPVAQGSHGIIKVMGDALGEVGLRSDQRVEIEKLAADAEARHQPMSEGRKELMLALADQIEKGTIDRAALQPKIDRMNADLEKARAEDRAALQRLHALLDSDQRNAFVDALERQFKAHRGPHDGPPHEGKPPMAFAGMGRLHALGDDLKLTDDQKTQIREAMKAEWKAQADKAHADGPPRDGEHGKRPHHFRHGKPGHGPRAGKHAFESFRSDKLELGEAMPPPNAPNAKMHAMGAGGMADFAEKIVPILTPEQRKIAADKLRAGAR